eukprot:1153194-Pelagomonas_calceolata.AAC.4
MLLIFGGVDGKLLGLLLTSCRGGCMGGDMSCLFSFVVVVVRACQAAGAAESLRWREAWIRVAWTRKNSVDKAWTREK